MRSRLHMIRTLAAVYRAWRALPTLRLNQLLQVASGCRAHDGTDLFYVEDHDVVGDCFEVRRPQR